MEDCSTIIFLDAPRHQTKINTCYMLAATKRKISERSQGFVEILRTSFPGLRSCKCVKHWGEVGFSLK